MNGHQDRLTFQGSKFLLWLTVCFLHGPSLKHSATSSSSSSAGQRLYFGENTMAGIKRISGERMYITTLGAVQLTTRDLLREQGRELERPFEVLVHEI